MNNSDKEKGHLLSILILVYSDVNEGVMLYSQLKSEITTQDYRILVIDNDCKDKSLLHDKVPKEHILVNERNQGYAGGNNVGVKKCLDDNDTYLLILNPDIKISIETIDELIKSMDQNEDAAFLGPRISYRNEPKIIYSDGGMVLKHKGYKVVHLNNRVHEEDIECQINEVDYMNGSAILGRLKAIRQIGILRHEFFIYFEETEWCLRAKDHGWKVLTNTYYKAYHLSSPKNRKYHFLMKRNKIWLAKMRKEYLGITVLRTLKDVGYALIRFNRRFPPFWLGMWHGILFKPSAHHKSNRTFFRL